MTQDHLFYALLFGCVLGLIFTLVSWRLECGIGSIKSMGEL